MKIQLYRNLLFDFLLVSKAGGLDGHADYVVASEPVDVDFVMLENIDLTAPTMAAFDAERDKSLADIESRRKKALSVLGDGA